MDSVFRSFLRSLAPAAGALAGLTLLTGIAYPALVTGLAAVLFPRQAGGSLLVVDGTTVGSSLVGQQFTSPAYLWPRPSATGPAPYTALSADNAFGSSGSNLGPGNPALVEAVKARAAALRASLPPGSHALDAEVPSDLVLASASGLDPHISPHAAAWQIDRIAAARKASPEAVRAVIERHREERTWGILGEPRINVLLVNLDLDRELPLPQGARVAP